MDGSLPSRADPSPPPDESGGVRFRAMRTRAVDLAARRDEWARLATEALEANVFLHPAFALPLLEHTAGDRGTDLWIVERSSNDVAELVGLVALGPSRRGRRTLAYSWQSLNACLGLPLFHRDHAGPALRAFLDARAADRPGLAGLVIQTLPFDGATSRLVREVAATQGLAIFERDGFTRPIFRPHTPAGRMLLSPKSSLDTPRLRTSRRRLERTGTLTHTIAQTRDDLPAAAAAFFALEAGGWKGRRGTAVASEDRSGAFVSAFVASLDPALHRVHALRLDGRPIAMAVLLRDRDGTDHFWKIAYDEAYSSDSPGRQLLVAVTRAQARAGVALTDSCAGPDDTLVAPRWPERRAFGHLAIALTSDRNGALAATFRRIDLVRRWRERLRRLARLRSFRATDAG